MNYENGESDNDQITILFLGSKRAGKTTIKEVCFSTPKIRDPRTKRSGPSITGLVEAAMLATFG